MPSIAETIRATISRLLNVGIPPDEAAIESRLILRRASGLSQEQLLANHSAQLPESAGTRLDRVLTRRETREPLAYILGEKEFYGRIFQVDRRVLIPRPETELLIELATQFADQNHLLQPNICDIGTGSGIIAITLANELHDAAITATDISDDALSIAKTNAVHHGVNIRFAIEDATQHQSPANFDIIVSNPPYIKSGNLDTLQPEVRDWEPRQALDGGPDGMNVLDPLICSLPNLLRKDGPSAAFIEIDPPVAEACLETARAALPDANIQIHLDYAGLERILVVIRA